ncbi:MAG: hypothetical protein ACLQRH_00730 [Acidimicrobiales bacterium]
MTVTRRSLRELERLAAAARRQYDRDVLKLPMGVQVNVPASEAISPSGHHGDAAVAHFEQVHRMGVALSQVLSDADEILAQSDDDEPDDEDLPPAS